MKLTKFLPAAAIAMCVPGMVLRALHFLNGFDVVTGLPATGAPWMWYCITLLLVCAVVYVIASIPLTNRKEAPFEQLLGTDSITFRMLAVISGALLIVGGICYLYFTFTIEPEDITQWTRIFEIIYSVFTVLTGISCISLAKSQAKEITAQSARLTLVPLLWSCMHLLVNYRMTCVDPKLPSFGFGLVSDVLVVAAFYFLAKLLYSKPNPAAFGACCALAVTSSVADLGGYALAWVMGVRAVSWPSQMVLRSGLTVSMCLMLAAELMVLAHKSEHA